MSNYSLNEMDLIIRNTLEDIGVTIIHKLFYSFDLDSGHLYLANHKHNHCIYVEYKGYTQRFWYYGNNNKKSFLLACEKMKEWFDVIYKLKPFGS